jgi:Domain of Unknown Function (DUF928)
MFCDSSGQPLLLLGVLYMLNPKQLLISGCVSALVTLEIVGIMGLSIERQSLGESIALAARPSRRGTGGKRGVCPPTASTSDSNQTGALVTFLPESDPQTTMLTSTATPTIYFYIPDRAEDLGDIQLRLHHGADSSDRTAFQVIPIASPQTPGILKVQFPNALKPGVTYTWKLALRCKANRTTTTTLSGDVTYTPLDAPVIAELSRATSAPQQAAIYITADRWLDAMPLLMEHQQLSTQSFDDILTAIGWEPPIYPDAAPDAVKASAQSPQH